MKKHGQNVKKYLSAFMLIVFAVALTPWSVIHHHQPAPVIQKEANCKHVSHIQTHGDTCLICNASFEKKLRSGAPNLSRISLCQGFAKERTCG